MQLVGFHVSKHFNESETLAEAIAAAAELSKKYGFSPCAQIFVTGPQGYRRLLSDADVRGLADSETVYVIHGAYVDNPWRADNGTSLENIKYEAKIAARIGAIGVIVHLGRGANDESILENTMRALAALPTTLWLEINAAKPGDHTFEKPSKLRRLYRRITAITPRPKIGFCIDTAHLWSCGVDMGDMDTAREWLEEVRAIGAPLLLHMNDSAAELGSGIDRHAPVGEGKMWRDRTDAAKFVAEWARAHCRMIVFEREETKIEQDLAFLAGKNEL